MLYWFMEYETIQFVEGQLKLTKYVQVVILALYKRESLTPAEIARRAKMPQAVKEIRETCLKLSKIQIRTDARKERRNLLSRTHIGGSLNKRYEFALPKDLAVLMILSYYKMADFFSDEELELPIRNLDILFEEHTTLNTFNKATRMGKAHIRNWFDYIRGEIFEVELVKREPMSKMKALLKSPRS